MKQLPEQFRKNTYNYIQVWRDEDYAIYRQEDAGKFVAYEVFKINKNKEREIAGQVFPPSETVPPDTQWGTNAWTVATMHQAEIKVFQMRQDAENRKNAILAAPAGSNFNDHTSG